MRQSQSNSIFQDKVSKEVKSYNPELHWIWIVGGSYEITSENHLFIKLLCKIITFEKISLTTFIFLCMFFSHTIIVSELVNREL